MGLDPESNRKRMVPVEGRAMRTWPGVTTIPNLRYHTMNPKSKELRQERAKLVAEMHDLTEKTGFPEESQKRWAELDKQQKELEARIKAVEATETLNEELRAVTPPPPGEQPNPNPGAEEDREAAVFASRQKEVVDRLESKEYKSAFFSFMRHGRDGCTPKQIGMMNETRNMEARTYSGLNIGTGTQGAFTVPIGFQRELEITMKAYGRMLANARILQTSTGNTLDWPTMDDTANSGEYVSEAAAVSQQNPTFGQVQFNSYLASSKQVLISVQLLQDSAFDLESELNQAFGIRLGRIINLKTTSGSGTGEPQGLVFAIQNATVPNIVNATGSNTNDGISGNTEANSVGSDDLDNLISAVDPSYRPQAHFMMNWRTIDFLRKLKDKYGRPLWVASLAVGEPDRIFGYPFDWNADMDTVAAGKYPILFGDFTKYLIRTIGGVTMVRSNGASSAAMWN